MTTTAPAGHVVRVAGALVSIEGLDAVSMFDLVQVGELGAPGEVIAVSGDRVQAQMYEYTGGFAPGDVAMGLGQPLSVPLGPGLLGGIFDGLLRPLVQAPDLLRAGWSTDDPQERRWTFVAAVAVGEEVEPGQVLGEVQETEAISHKVLVPPGVAGTVSWVGDGDLMHADLVAKVGTTEVALASRWPVRHPRPVAERLPLDTPLTTGQRVIDTLFPVAVGSTAAVPGGFGTGKTILLQQISKWCDADVIVYVGCGERGNEMAEVLADLPELRDPRTGRSLMDRTVIIVNTSNMPVMAREVSIYTGMTVAEYYRDMGYSSVVVADSTSRWAEAMREFASRTGQLPTEEGYPAGLGSALAAFYERAGRVRTLAGETGAVTVVAAVSPPGGDKTEPVTSHTQRFVRALWSLDRDLAAARHYPAVSWHESFSRDADLLAGSHVRAGDPEWPVRRARAMTILAEADELEAVVQLVGRQALPDHQRMILLVARLIREGVLQQNALSANDAFADPVKQVALLDMMLAINDTCRSLVDRGTPASVIEEVDFSEVIRIREAAGPEDSEAVEAVRDRMLAELENLR